MKNISLTISILLLIFLTKNSFAQDWANFNRYKAENETLLLEKFDTNRIVFIGNSITESWKSMRPEYFLNNSYVNRGISGQTSPQMLIRFRSDVVDLKPEVVVILAGTNDIAGNTGKSTITMIANNIKSMVEIAQANGIKVVLSSVHPVYDYPWKKGLQPAEKIINLNSILKTYASIKEVEFLDYFQAMVDSRKGLKEALTYDGVHPNIEGYKIMEVLAEKAIARAMGIKN